MCAYIYIYCIYVQHIRNNNGGFIVGTMKVWGWLMQYIHPKTSHSLTMKQYWLGKTKVLDDSIINCLIPSDQCNLTMATTMGLVFSLFDICFRCLVACSSMYSVLTRVLFLCAIHFSDSHACQFASGK